MKKIFSINSSIKTLFFVLFLFSTTLQAQSILDSYEGIPIETSLDWDWVENNATAVDSMRIAGVDILHLSFQRLSQIDSITNTNQPDLKFNFDILPITTPGSNAAVYNWIQYYTDAKYSVWEAEGTPTEKGNATLYRDEDKTEKIDNQYIRLKDDFTGSPCLISWGPYYLQDVEYETYQNGGSGTTKVEYTAEFWLKLELISQDNAAPTDTLCILQVTQSTWELACSDTVTEIAVTRGNFATFNTFIPIRIENYKLDNFDCPRSTNNILPPANHHFSTDYLLDGIAPGPRWIRERIEFKVIWKGNPNYSLCFDKVIVSDERGLQIKGNLGKSRIDEQVTFLSAYPNSIFGWLGIDEPQSIDQFEPIRVVDSLIRAGSQNQKALVVPIMGCLWDGTFSHFNDAGAMRLNKYEELSKRIGDLNIIQNAYMFDTPCYSGNDTLDKCDDGDIRAINISIAANDIYKHAYHYFPKFGAACNAVRFIMNKQTNGMLQDTKFYIVQILL